MLSTFDVLRSLESVGQSASDRGSGAVARVRNEERKARDVSRRRNEGHTRRERRRAWGESMQGVGRKARRDEMDKCG